MRAKWHIPQACYRFPVNKQDTANKSFKHDRLSVWISGVGETWSTFENLESV